MKLNEEGLTGYNITKSAPLFAVIGEKIFPHGFTPDATSLTQKEIFDAVLVVKSANPDDIAKFINSASDALVLARKDNVLNKIADLEIRLFIANMALGLADVMGKYNIV